MKRTLLTVLLAGAVSSAAFGEGAVAHAPGQLLALNDLDTRISSAYQQRAAAKTTASLDTNSHVEELAEKLNKQLDAQLRERMQRDLAIAMQ